LKIRTAHEEDAKAISALVIDAAEAHIRDEFTEEGWELLLRLYSEDCQKKLIKSNEYRYFLAEEKEALVGVLSIKNRNHIFQFFVSTKQHKTGVGTQLWHHYLNATEGGVFDEQPIGKISVKASNYGTPFYLKLGFHISGQRQLKNGVYYTPLIFLLE